MRHSGMALVLAMSLTAGAAYAGPTASARSEAAGPRALYICDGSTETRRALTRLHGSVEYVSADEAIAAQAAGETWATPRCIKEAEFKRLQSMQDKARLVQTSAR